MQHTISVVPNVCEGRDEKFVHAVQEKLEAVPSLVLLDVSMDQVRNRTIFSFMGGKEAIFEGGFLIYQEALDRVDMRQHHGEYPRIGAVDVFPFVALRDTALATAVAWSAEFAEQVARRFGVPVYLFAEAARHPMRRDIEMIREGEYEGFADKMADPSWKPDFGPDTFPPDKGATIIGARLPIVNLKAYLTSADEEAAAWVAETLSSSASGLPGVHFYPGLDRTRNTALLSITIGNFRSTPLYRVLEAIRTELRRFGTGVSRVEMVGLVPQYALIESAEHYLQLMEFSMEDVLEHRLDTILENR